MYHSQQTYNHNIPVTYILLIVVAETTDRYHALMLKADTNYYQTITPYAMEEPTCVYGSKILTTSRPIVCPPLATKF